MARRRPVAAPPRAHRRRPAAVPHRELRAVPRGAAGLLTGGPMLETASALLGEPAVLYKEKINYKLPGGAGYSPHQDAPAYRFVDTHVSCMVAVDDALVGNGCLEVVSACHEELLPTDDVGLHPSRRRRRRSSGCRWRCGPARRCGSTPAHRTAAVRTSAPTPRRALYPTYNALREGDLRAAYYEQKALELAGGSSVSLDRRLPGEDRVTAAGVRRRGARAVRALRRPHTTTRCSASSPTPSRPLPWLGAAGASDEVVVAALLHDVGHLLEMAERRRAARSQRRPPPRGGRCGVARPAVRPGGHRPDRPPRARQALPLRGRAGRTTTASRPGSVASLERQGGPLTADEVAALRGQPGLGGRGGAAPLGRPGQGARPRGGRRSSPTARCWSASAGEAQAERVAERRRRRSSS